MERRRGELITREALEALKRIQSNDPNAGSVPSQRSFEQPIKIRKKLPLFDWQNDTSLSDK